MRALCLKCANVCAFASRIALCLLVLVSLPTWAAEAIPAEALRLRSSLIREARTQWGLAAPTATFAAQIHQESRWRKGALSPVGAQGMAQVMPATATWLAQAFPALAGGDAFSPLWSIRALLTYDRWLWQRLAGADDCQRMAKTLRSYNGGLGWIQRDTKLAASRGINASVNFGQLDRVNAGRSAAAFAENTDYPRLILLRYEPVYERAGFGPGVCA